MRLPNGGIAIMTFGIGLPPYTHGHVKCSNCGTVVARCGCALGCDLVATIDKCVNCACDVDSKGEPHISSRPEDRYA